MKISLPSHLRLHDHSNALDGSPIAGAGVPWLLVPATGLRIGGDVNLDRLAAAILRTDSLIYVARAGAGSQALGLLVTGDGQYRWRAYCSGILEWGDGAAVPDTNLYRASPNVLKSDDTIESGVGFRFPDASNQYSAATISKLVSASGSLASDAAAVNLSTVAITGLAVTDFIMVVWRHYTGQNVNGVKLLRNVTDAQDMLTLLTADAAIATADLSAQILAHQRPGDNTRFITSGRRQKVPFPAVDLVDSVPGATGWTGNWTLALRHTPGTAGGTDYWAWSVYKLA